MRRLPAFILKSVTVSTHKVKSPTYLVATRKTAGAARIRLSGAIKAITKPAARLGHATTYCIGTRDSGQGSATARAKTIARENSA